MSAGTAPLNANGLTRGEIHKLVHKYIGVSMGYLGDFTYKSHYEFYVELDLDFNPYNHQGTTRAIFIEIISNARPEIQARILEGILERYAIGSTPTRTQRLKDEIHDWIKRLRTFGVSAPAPRTTSAVVKRALSDAEQLISSSGATSGVDRVHTALHGYLLEICREGKITVPTEASLTQLFKLLRTHHPAFGTAGPRPDDIVRVLNSMANVMDVLNPIRNRASVAHPNAALLDEPEASLAINAAKTLLHYVDAKLDAFK